MDTIKLEITVQVDPDEWRRWDGNAPTPMDVVDWVTEVFAVSQGSQEGAAQLVHIGDVTATRQRAQELRAQQGEAARERLGFDPRELRAAVGLPAPVPAVDVRASLGQAGEYARLAGRALADEHEANVRYYTAALERLAVAVAAAVRSW